VLGTADGAQIYSANAPKITADRASLASDEAKARSGGSSRLAINTGNAYYGYGEYAKAADLFRVALSKGDVDAPLANLRLGEALAMAGDRAGAAAAFKAVTGPRADLAALWTTWLAMPH
jgi:TolA-binding protein